MCETCNLLDKMYEAIDVKDPNIRIMAQDMIYETAQQIPEVVRYNVAYHKCIGSTP